MADEEVEETKDTTAEPDPSNWEKAESVTGRPNDIPIDDPAPAPLGGNSTMAERAAARKKAVGSAQNKQVSDDDAEVKKPARRKTAAKKG